MDDFGAAFSLAFQLILAGDPTITEIVLRSLAVSLTADEPRPAAGRAFCRGEIVL